MPGLSSSIQGGFVSSHYENGFRYSGSSQACKLLNPRGFGFGVAQGLLTRKR